MPVRVAIIDRLVHALDELHPLHRLGIAAVVLGHFRGAAGRGGPDVLHLDPQLPRQLRPARLVRGAQHVRIESDVEQRATRREQLPARGADVAPAGILDDEGPAGLIEVLQELVALEHVQHHQAAHNSAKAETDDRGEHHHPAIRGKSL